MTEKTMCVVVPSRTRPASIERLAEAFEDTGALATLLVLLVLEQDPRAPGDAGIGEHVVVGHQQARREHEAGAEVGLAAVEDLEARDGPQGLATE